MFWFQTPLHNAAFSEKGDAGDSAAEWSQHQSKKCKKYLFGDFILLIRIANTHGRWQPHKALSISWMLPSSSGPWTSILSTKDAFMMKFVFQRSRRQVGHTYFWLRWMISAFCWYFLYFLLFLLHGKDTILRKTAGIILNFFSLLPCWRVGLRQ